MTDLATQDSERMRVRGLSAGHIIARSRELGPDPWPDVSVGAPPTHAWLYSRGQFELAALHGLADEGLAANKHVDYAGNYGSLESVVSFRCDLGGVEDSHELRFWATGDVSVVITSDPAAGAGVGDSRPFEASGETGEAHVLALPAGARSIEITVTASDGGAAAIAIPVDARGGGVADADASRGWASSAAGTHWHAVSTRLGGVVPPHRAREPIHRRALVRVGGDVWRLDAPALGRLFVACDSRPVVAVGESDAEALADEDDRESRCDVHLVTPGLWVTRHRLGFRYAVVRGVEPTSVFVEANVRDAPTRGGFISDDPVLDAIWATSAFTLRTCTQVLVLDGIKRDRMPWAGDLVVSTVANAYAFGDGEVIRTGLRALGRPRHGFVNGIADYSLWWVVGQSLYQRHFGDAPFAQAEAEGVHAFLSHLALRCDPDGVFRPGEERDAFVGAGPGSVFIDWGVVIDPDRDSTALQMLWYWAVASAGSLLGSAGHQEAAGWRALGDRIANTMRRRAWDASAGAWREYLDEVAFWEEFPRGAASDHEMYGRPFGKSLCHAWASSPAGLIPSIVLGIRPLSDGWRTFEVDPALGSMAWAAAVVPVPSGRIVVTARAEGSVIVDIPAGCELVRGDAVVAGPRCVDWATLS